MSYCTHCAQPTTNESGLCEAHDGPGALIVYCCDCSNLIGDYKSPWETPTCKACDDKSVGECEHCHKPINTEGGANSYCAECWELNRLGSDENENLTLCDNGKAQGTVTFRFDLKALADPGEKGIKARLALRKLADLMQTAEVETLDGSDMGVTGVYDYIPEHCVECGELLPDWMVAEHKRYGGPFPEEIGHEPKGKQGHGLSVCNKASWQPTEAKQRAWETRNEKRRKTGEGAKKRAPET